jgi:hypothetical protein
MLHNGVQVVLLTMIHAVAWGRTAAPHTAASNSGLAGLPQAPLQAHARLTCCCCGLKNPGGSREEHMQKHTGRARFSKRSNKEACSMKAQWHAAHRSTQDGVAGLPGIVFHKYFNGISQVFKHAS